MGTHDPSFVPVLLAIFVGGPGNVFVVLILSRCPLLHTPHNIFHGNIAIIDIINCLIAAPLLSISWYQGTWGTETRKSLCEATMGLIQVNQIININSLIMIAIIRVKVALKPFHKLSRKMSTILVALTWIAGTGDLILLLTTNKFLLPVQVCIYHAMESEHVHNATYTNFKEMIGFLNSNGGLPLAIGNPNQVLCLLHILALIIISTVCYTIMYRKARELSKNSVSVISHHSNSSQMESQGSTKFTGYQPKKQTIKMETTGSDRAVDNNDFRLKYMPANEFDYSCSLSPPIVHVQQTPQDPRPSRNLVEPISDPRCEMVFVEPDSIENQNDTCVASSTGHSYDMTYKLDGSTGKTKKTYGHSGHSNQNKRSRQNQRKASQKQQSICHMPKQENKGFPKESELTSNYVLQLAKTGVILTFVFLLSSSFPILCFVLVSNEMPISSMVYKFGISFIFVQSFLNPFIYMWRNKTFREEVKKIFKRQCYGRNSNQNPRLNHI